MFSITLHLRKSDVKLLGQEATGPSMSGGAGGPWGAVVAQTIWLSGVS